MPLVVRAFPLRRPVAELEAFAEELRAGRNADAAAFYRRYGVSHESWHVQETSNGPWIIGVTMVDNPVESAPRYAKATDAFDSWFKQKVHHLSGIDPDQQPLGPPTAQVFAWSDEQRPDSNLCA